MVANPRQEFAQLVDEVELLSPTAWYILNKADYEFVAKGHRVSTACVTKVGASGFMFTFATELWERLTIQEKLFIMLHECAHVYHGHFVRDFNKYKQYTDKEIAWAVDLAVNSQLLKAFTFKVDDLPFLREFGCWPDTILEHKGIVLPEQLSVEDYLVLLALNRDTPTPSQQQANQQQEGGASSKPGSGGEPTTLDDHLESTGTSIPDRFKTEKEKPAPRPYNPDDDDDGEEPISKPGPAKPKLVDAIAKKLGVNSDDAKRRIAKDIAKLLGDKAAVGLGVSPELLGLEVDLSKPVSPWKRFARPFIKEALKFRDEERWIKPRRIMAMDVGNVFLPSEHEAELQGKVRINLFLDTSGSCSSMVPHFIAFAKAMPEDLFEVRTFGFNSVVYDINLKDPKFKYGGTLFAPIIQAHEELSVNRKAYCFVFTDLDAFDWGKCNFSRPKEWHWFHYVEDSRLLHRIPAGSKSHLLEDFE